METKKQTYANLSYVLVLGEGKCLTGECPGNMSGGTCPVPAVPNYCSQTVVSPTTECR